MAACPPGVLARTVGPTGPFTAGWVRFTLQPCPGAPADAPAAELEADGADRVLLVSPGRPGGATAALLTATDRPVAGGPQRFALAARSARAREVVLAPWPSAGPPPRLSGLRLLAAP